MNIFLIGFMGSGKTTIGKRLARVLNREFIDMDDYIVKKQGISINKIFEEDGEVVFREIEKKILQEFFQMENKIIATGGGAPCYFDNMEQMNAHGQTFYLKMPAKGLADRLVRGMEKRPLIKGKTRGELEEFIAVTLQKREPFYSGAKHVIPAMDMKVEDFFPYVS